MGQGSRFYFPLSAFRFPLPSPAPAAPECPRDYATATGLWTTGIRFRNAPAFASASAPRLLQREGNRVGIGSLKQSVQNQPLIAHADGREFIAGAFRFRQRRPLRPAHQHERRAFAIGQRRHGVFINHPLLFQTRQRAETGIAGRVACPESRSTRRAASSAAACGPSARCRK